MTINAASFDSWSAVLSFVAKGGRLSYKAPMSVHACSVRVVRVFKNGKTRLDPGHANGDPFTADPVHLERMRAGSMPVVCPDE